MNIIEAKTKFTPGETELFDEWSSEEPDSLTKWCEINGIQTYYRGQNFGASIGGIRSTGETVEEAVKKLAEFLGWDLETTGLVNFL